ncbi:MAG: phosphotransferase [Kiritimatiellae bacterium]|nr:phosphotransferase [Kiritimatiellia bacterium]
MSVRKAVVLAAGHGTRLRPFTCATPKPLLPVWGGPMLGRIVSLLRSRGVDDFVVNSHHLAEQIRAWTDAWRRAAQAAGDKVRIKVSHEPEILGSGGALNPVRDWIGGEPFYLVSSDIVMENVPDVAAAFESDASPDAIGCALVSESGPRTVEVEPASGFVTNWRSDDAGADGTFTYCGFAVLSPEILSYVRPDGFSSIVAAYERAAMDGRFVRAVRSDGLLWEDAGTVRRYVELNSDGDDNAFADIPQLRELGATHPRFLGARGSERVFFSCDRGIAILYDDGNRDENGKYPGHTRWLKGKGMPVPDVVADIPSMKAMILSDAGKERRMSLEDYVRVVEALVKFNALGTEPDLPDDLLPPFDDETWEWERGLFAKYCLGANFRREMPEAAARELEGVAERLTREPPALVHRDFQSTNVLWKGDGLTFIDYQGMRIGPAAYDLASLVYDPYVKFTDGERRALVALYAKKSGRPEMVEVLPFAAVQRLVQCLGAYGRLASVGQPHFAVHVLPALENLLDAADRAGLDAVGALAEDLIAAHVKAHPHGADGHGRCSCGRCG